MPRLWVFASALSVFVLGMAAFSAIAGAITTVLYASRGTLPWSATAAPIVNAGVSGSVMGLFWGLVTLLIYRPLFHPGKPFDDVAVAAIASIGWLLSAIGLINGAVVAWSTFLGQHGAFIWNWTPVR
jgi:hypothetical protein